MAEYYGESVAYEMREIARIVRERSLEEYKLNLGRYIQLNFPASLISRTSTLIEDLSKGSNKAIEERIRKDFPSYLGIDKYLGLEDAESQLGINLNLKGSVEDLLQENFNLRQVHLKERSSASYVTSVLRPLSISELDRTLNQRNDITPERIRKRASNLLATQITSFQDFKEWAGDVFLMFEEVSIFDIEESNRGLINRPYGTISSSSKRPYLLAWKNATDPGMFDLITSECDKRAKALSDGIIETAPVLDENRVKNASTFSKFVKTAALTALNPAMGTLVIAIAGSNEISKKWKLENLKANSLVDWVGMVDNLYKTSRDKVQAKIEFEHEGEETSFVIGADDWNSTKQEMVNTFDTFLKSSDSLFESNPELRKRLETEINQINTEDFS